MKPDEREKTKKKSILEISGPAGTFIVLFLVVAAVWIVRLGSGDNVKKTEVEDKLIEERKVLNQGISLQTALNRLHFLDETYGLLVAGNEEPMKLDSFELILKAEEARLKIKIDSFAQQSSHFNIWANVVMTDSITSAFRTALVNRRFRQELRKPFPGKQMNLGENEKNLLMREAELHKKEERLILQESQLKKDIGSRTKNISDPGLEIIKQENEALRLALTGEENSSAKLLDITLNLKKENEKQSAQINALRRSASADAASFRTLKSRNVTLEAQINELGAELNFSRIDCNLTRANAQKIISNSRQRRALLGEALRSLQDLSNSDNAHVQKKAREKINMLNEIASTVRD